MTIDRGIGRRVVYATDNSIHQWRPSGVAAPRTAAEVVAVVLAAAGETPPPALVARGGGTGTNGQSLTDGLVIDTKRHLHRIVAVDPTARTAVVEPGVVADRLDDELRSHGLFWAPHTSTRNRATVGGMIATDAAGKGSLIHGRTHRHVAAVDLVLADGTTWTAAPLTRAEAELEAERPGRVGRIWRLLLELEPASSIGLPELARGFTGYGISRVHHDGLVDPIPVVCGSEGTLGIVVRATLRLTPIPAVTTLVVAAYTDFDAALRDSIELSTTSPAALEVCDGITLERGRSSPGWAALGSRVGEGSPASPVGAVLLGDYHRADLGPVVDQLERQGRATRVSVVTDPADRAAIWKVRADAVGLLARVPHGAPRPTAFVEDCAVPVAAMPDFIAEFRSLLDRHGLEYAMFGHADVGCVHVRPALDPVGADHEALVAIVTAEVVDLVAAHGGLLWGEHGRGLRGSVVDHFLEPDTVDLMRAVKTAFDPDDRCNPGKLYRPFDGPALRTGHGKQLTTGALLGLEDVPRRASADRAVPVSIRRTYASAFDCNGNGLCHHDGDAEVMCPSFKITGDPFQSPKGRADLLRAWLHAEHTGAADPELADAVAASLATCLSCGACTGRCPVQVDIPELKSRFLATYHRRRRHRRRRPVRELALARFESIAPRLVALPDRARPAVRRTLPILERCLGLVDLPLPPLRSDHPDPRPIGTFADDVEADVVVLPDVFSAVFDPAELAAACSVLESTGLRVAVAELVPSAKFEHVKGLRSRFRRAAARQRALVERIQASGAVAVSIEPAVGLMHDHEYPAIDPGYPRLAVRSIVELLVERSEHLDRVDPARARTVHLFAHCTQQAMRPQSIEQWASVLRTVGHDVVVVDTGCCGMAGVFGHEAEHAGMSSALFDRLWRPHLERILTDPTARAAATGWSCRSQAARHGFDVASPLRLLPSPQAARA